MSETQKKIWACKIGEVDPALVPNGADLPMRAAVRDAFFALTGEQAEFVFSGWGATLDETERAVIEDREPSPEHYADWLKREAAPELYEALKVAREYMRHCFGSRYEGPDPYPIIDAALLKATPEHSDV